MLMNGINGLVTIANYWKEWSDPRLIVMVLANRDLNQVTWEQRVMAGDPKYECSQTVPKFEFARYAEMLGLPGSGSTRPNRSARPGRSALIRSSGGLRSDDRSRSADVAAAHHISNRQRSSRIDDSKAIRISGIMIKQTFKDAVEAILPHKG